MDLSIIKVYIYRRITRVIDIRNCNNIVGVKCISASLSIQTEYRYYKEEKYKQPLKDIALRGSHRKIIVIIFNSVTGLNYRRLIHGISFQSYVCIGSHSPAFSID